jgi:hypothetical protein
MVWPPTRLARSWSPPSPFVPPMVASPGRLHYSWRMNQKRPALFQQGDQYLADLGDGYSIDWRRFRDSAGDEHFFVKINTPPNAQMEAVHDNGTRTGQDSSALLRQELARVDELLAAWAARQDDPAAPGIVRRIIEHKAMLLRAAKATGGIPDPMPDITRH